VTVSKENVEIIRDAFEGAGVEGLAEVARTYWHPDVVYVEDPRWPGAARYEGRDAVLGCFKAYADALGAGQDMAVTVERVYDGGQHQVVLVRYQGQSASGLPHEHLWAYVVEVRERQIVYFRAYYEPEEAFGAAGLRR
jgi:ketosteroid isomerase-like protein